MTSTDSPKSILVVEEDTTRAKSIQAALIANGFSCEMSHTGTSAVNMAQASSFDVFVLNLALADDSGLGVLRCLRENDDKAGIILLTPMNFHQERIAGLEAGADDFVVTPCATDEIVVRVQAVEAP